MNEQSGFYFQSYDEWRQALTERCGIKLTPDYAQSRILALQDANNRDTQEFSSKYGNAYREQVIQWFERAANES